MISLFIFLLVCISKKSICQKKIYETFLEQRNFKQKNFNEVVKIWPFKSVFFGNTIRFKTKIQFQVISIIIVWDFFVNKKLR